MTFISYRAWQNGLLVGHTTHGEKLVYIATAPHRKTTFMLPSEARDLADELYLRADFQDGDPTVKNVNGILRRIPK